jgi:hypothetical protein
MIEKPPEKGTKSPGRCPFECNAIEGDASAPPAQVRITKCVSHHGCSQGHGRKRAVPLSVRRAQSTTLESFIPVANRRGGNVAQLQEVARQQDGIHVKKGQVCNALQGKSGTICAHLASHRILHSPHTVQSDTTRCGVSRVGHAAKRSRLYRSDTDFTFTGSNFSRLPWNNNNVAIVKKRKKLNKERKERFGGRVVLENDLTQK